MDLFWPNSDPDHLILSSSQMMDMENKLFSLGMPAEALMEKVGLAMSKWFFSNSYLLENGVVILIGPGHNGGDGLVLARELYLAGVEVCIWCPLPIKKTLTANHLAYCISIGIRNLENSPEISLKSLWVEALFGLGQTKALPKQIGLLFQEREKVNPGNLISLDIPAGISSDTGEKLDAMAVVASKTLTVGFYKSGLIQDIALPYVGDVVRIDLGIPAVVYKSLPEFVPLSISSKDIAGIEYPRSEINASKYQRGRFLLLGGSKKYRGASLLALKGAIASGVGSIQAFLPETVSKQLWTVVPEVICHDLPQNFSISQSISKISLDRIDSLLIGPGLGLLGEEWDHFASPLENFLGLLVIDADALNRMAVSLNGWEWLKKRSGPTWITPHIHEFKRLFPEIDIAFPLKAALEAARKTGACVLLKGAHSVIASPDGFVWQLIETCPYVARTGLGDVLAGFVAGVGALSLQSAGKTFCKTFSMAVLIHAFAASSSLDGTNANYVSKNLTKLVKNIQSKNVRIDTFMGVK